ncbi:hypothetical protein C8Q77DRAFT_1162230 [Trametes polyzona]|nr:hypothetical protein C8Q77DRAFT_1162230 [Trametes polyzona]
MSVRSPISTIFSPTISIAATTALSNSIPPNLTKPSPSADETVFNGSPPGHRVVLPYVAPALGLVVGGLALTLWSFSQLSTPDPNPFLTPTASIIYSSDAGHTDLELAGSLISTGTESHDAANGSAVSSAASVHSAAALVLVIPEPPRAVLARHIPRSKEGRVEPRLRTANPSGSADLDCPLSRAEFGEKHTLEVNTSTPRPPESTVRGGSPPPRHSGHASVSSIARRVQAFLRRLSAGGWSFGSAAARSESLPEYDAQMLPDYSSEGGSSRRLRTAS